MTVEQLDQLLTQWRSELDGVQANLIELEDMMIYRIMKEKREREDTEQRDDLLTGVTEQKVNRAFEAVANLWKELASLEAVYKSAHDKRQALPTFGKGKAIDEIEKILTADIELDSEEVPFDQRGLFSAAQRKHKIGARELKEMMARSFDSAKKVFLQLQERVSTLHDQFEAVNTEAQALKTTALSYSPALPSEMSDLLARLESTNKRRKKDPLSVTTDLRLDMRPYLEKARSKVVELGRERDKIRQDVDGATAKLEQIAKLYEKHLKRNDAAAITKPLSDWLETLKKALADGKWDTARTGINDWYREADVLAGLIAEIKNCNVRLEQVKTLRARCLELYKTCEAEIENPEGLVTPGGTKSLTEWLDTLTEALAEKRFDATKTGLADWNRDCEQLRTSIEAGIQANQRPIEKKKELARRWAEAQRLTEEYKGKGLVVDKALGKFAEKATALMSAAKVDLKQADTMIYSYETRLGELASKL